MPMSREQETAMLDQPDDFPIPNVSEFGESKREFFRQLSSGERQVFLYDMLVQIQSDMLTADRVVDTITDNLPVWVAKLQELSNKYPFLKTMLKFL